VVTALTPKPLSMRERGVDVNDFSENYFVSTSRTLKIYRQN
jgi:hypothetical protein